MKDDQLDPEIAKILKEVKLKEPKPGEMNHYLSQVRSKIEHEQSRPHFHFVPIGAAFAFTLALAGFFYFAVYQQPHKNQPQAAAVSQIPDQMDKSTPEQNLSLEEQIAILEAFNEEYPNETNDLLGEEGVLEDLILMDQIEFAVLPANSQNASASLRS